VNCAETEGREERGGRRGEEGEGRKERGGRRGEEGEGRRTGRKVSKMIIALYMGVLHRERVGRYR